MMILIAILFTLLKCFSHEKYTWSARIFRVSSDKYFVEIDEAY